MKKFLLILLSLFLFANLTFAQGNPALNKATESMGEELYNSIPVNIRDTYFLRISELEARYGKYSDLDVLRGLVKIRQAERYKYSVSQKPLISDAVQYFNRALTKNNFSSAHVESECYYQLASLTNDNNVKLNYLSKAIALDNDVYCYVDRAHVKLLMNDINGALADIKYASRYDNSQRAVTVLGLVSEAIGDINSAVKYYKKVIDVDSKYQMKAECLSLVGTGLEKTPMCQNKLFYPNENNVTAATRLALIYLSQAKYQEANSICEELTVYHNKKTIDVINNTKVYVKIHPETQDYLTLKKKLESLKK